MNLPYKNKEHDEFYLADKRYRTDDTEKNVRVTRRKKPKSTIQLMKHSQTKKGNEAKAKGR